LLQDAAAAVAATAPADEPAEPAEADPTQRDSWEGVEPSYAAHYKSDDERPNMCKVAHRVPAPLGKQQYNFTEGQKDYIPYIGRQVLVSTRKPALQSCKYHHPFGGRAVVAQSLLGHAACDTDTPTCCTSPALLVVHAHPGTSVVRDSQLMLMRLYYR
jgi:hypothetical protein